MQWLLDHGDKLGGLATIGVLIVTIVAAAVAIYQIRETRSSQRAATAKNIYGDYLKLAFENPRFANPTQFMGNSGWRDANEWIGDEKYRWFVAFMLNSYDEISGSDPQDAIWQDVICEDMKFHAEYLKSNAFLVAERGWDMYSPGLKTIASKAGLCGHPAKTIS